MIKKLLAYSEQLKKLARTGWKNKGINNPETVASHSWQMALMALYLSSKVKDTYDFDKVIKLCLCHDLAESVIGDITPHDAKYSQKSVIEKRAIETIAKESDFAEVAILFEEYENKITPEAVLANDLDKLDMYVQALEYEKAYPNFDLKEFKESAIAQIKTPLGKTILKELEQ